MNTQIKHTPGPWKYCCTAYDELRGIPPVALEVRAETNGMYKPYICDVRSINSNGNDNTIANAALIAAAPAMYLELKEGLVLLEASHHDMVDMYGIDSLQAKTVWERIESTRNTLAQAEGK